VYHRSIASTVRYTALAPDRFKGFWKDYDGSATGTRVPWMWGLLKLP
jgi:hypothetical protein